MHDGIANQSADLEVTMLGVGALNDVPLRTGNVGLVNQSLSGVECIVVPLVQGEIRLVDAPLLVRTATRAFEALLQVALGKVQPKLEDHCAEKGQNVVATSLPVLGVFNLQSPHGKQHVEANGT